MKNNFFFFLLFSFSQIYSQSVTIIPSGKAAQIEAKSNNSGTLIQRMTSQERLSITNPQVGLLTYDTEKGALFLFDGQKWLPLAFANPNNINTVEKTSQVNSRGVYFGTKVAMENDYAIISTPANQFVTGSVYIFKRDSENGWQEIQRLYPNDGGKIASDIAISGDYIFVGSSVINNQNSFVYVFKKQNENSWIQYQKLSARGIRQETDLFGSSIDIDGNYAVIGSYSEGVVYIYKLINETWSQVSRINGDNSGAWFGYSVAIDGQNIAVSAIFENGTRGAVYIFRKYDDTFWYSIKKIDGFQEREQFGWTLTMSANKLAIGSPYYNFFLEGKEYIANGRVYIYSTNTGSWNFEGQYDSPTQQAYQNFGFSVAMSGQKVIIGAPNFTEEYYQQGRVYLYEWSIPSNLGSGFSYIGRITENNQNQDSYTGKSVAISNQYFIIGSPGYKVGTGKVLFGNTQ